MVCNTTSVHSNKKGAAEEGGEMYITVGEYMKNRLALRTGSVFRLQKNTKPSAHLSSPLLTLCCLLGCRNCCCTLAIAFCCAEPPLSTRDAGWESGATGAAMGGA